MTTIACDCHPDEDVQCARCGSSMGWEDCSQCDGGEYHLDDSEHFDEWRTCEWCYGRGGWYLCLSNDEDPAEAPARSWCEAHPNEGRENVAAGTEEPFIVHEQHCAKAKASGQFVELSGPVPGLGTPEADSTAPDPLDASESRTGTLRTTAPLGPESAS